MEPSEADERVTRAWALALAKRAWPHARSITCGVDAFRPDVRRALYERLAPADAPLPAEALTWSRVEPPPGSLEPSWLLADGRGVLVLSRQCGFMPGVGEVLTAFVLADDALVEGECHWEDNISDPTTVTFAVRAPSPDALDRAAASVFSVLDAFGYAPAVSS